jgi:hypothetical protein
MTNIIEEILDFDKNFLDNYLFIVKNKNVSSLLKFYCYWLF